MSEPAKQNGQPAVGKTRVVLEWTVPSDVRFIEHIVGSVTRQCSVLDFPSRFCSLNVPVALTEAISNAMLRGNREDPEKIVRVCARADRHAIVMEVTDEGPGFDLNGCTVDASSPEHLVEENGRGLFLMRALMDHVERFDLDGDGSVVRLTLKRP